MSFSIVIKHAGNWGVDEADAEHNIKQRFDAIFYQARQLLQFDQARRLSGATHLVRGTGSHDSAPGEISTTAPIGQASVLGLHLKVTYRETHGAAD